MSKHFFFCLFFGMCVPSFVYNCFLKGYVPVCLCVLHRDVQEGSGVYNDSSRYRHSQTLPHPDVIGAAPRGSGSDLGLSQSYHTGQADQGGAVHRAGLDWSSTGNIVDANILF